MIDGKLVSRKYKKRKEIKKYIGCPISIIAENGVCSIESTIDVCGIELEILGSANITSTLPKNWIVRSNKSKFIMFNLDLTPIQNSRLFVYQGDIKIKNATFCDKDGIVIPYKIFKQPVIFGALDWTYNAQDENWNKKSRQKRPTGQIIHRKKRNDALDNAIMEHKNLEGGSY